MTAKNRSGIQIAGLWIVALLPMAWGSSAAENPPASGAALKKEYVLFAAAQLSVEVNRELQQVIDVSKSSFIVGDASRQWTIPMDRDPGTLRVNYALALTEARASVSDLSIQRAYTFANNPMRRRSVEAIHVRTQLADDLSLAQHASAGGLGMVTLSHSYMTRQGARGDPENEVMQIQAQIDSGLGSTMEQAREVMADEVKELYDAIDISFSVSAEQPLDHPYALLIVRFHEPGADKGLVRNWIFAKELQYVSAQPRTFTFRQGGFPKGFDIVDSQLHLYNHGHEVATNVASNRMELSRDEAHLYAKMDYIAAHKGETRAPALALARATPKRPGSAARPTSRCFVKVSKEGLPVEGFSDEGCRSKLENPSLVKALGELRFLPALEKGIPVEGVLAVDLVSPKT